MSESSVTERLLARLKAGVDSGYYRRDAALSHIATGTLFPWQNKTCGDCPFWQPQTCRVVGDPRTATAPTCGFFDPPNHADARTRVEAREGKSFGPLPGE